MTSFRNYRAMLFASIAYLLINFCSCDGDGYYTSDEQVLEARDSNRTSKNFFPFVWVRFQPSPCGTDLDGVCVQRGKCAKQGGRANGNCQDTFGECCIFEAQCNENITQINVNQLVTVLKTPTPYNTQCSFRFQKEPNICQIRLDFEQFMTTNANENGTCEIDRLKVANTITVDPGFTTCGDLTNQHMYLTFENQDTIEVTPILKMASSTYRIIATRIPCDSRNRAPDYCLQYFAKTTDTVRSFGYPVQQQNNQRYTVCVKPMTQSTEVEWKPCAVSTAVPSSFDIQTPLPFPGTCIDWVEVKGKGRHCTEFPLSETSPWKPYELLVNFDGSELPPPPVPITMPVRPGPDCNADCVGLGTPTFMCGPTCNAAGQCICYQVPAPAPNDPNPPHIDIENRGFCLEYTQL